VDKNDYSVIIKLALNGAMTTIKASLVARMGSHVSAGKGSLGTDYDAGGQGRPRLCCCCAHSVQIDIVSPLNAYAYAMRAASDYYFHHLVLILLFREIVLRRYPFASLLLVWFVHSAARAHLGPSVHCTCNRISICCPIEAYGRTHLHAEPGSWSSPRPCHLPVRQRHLFFVSHFRHQ